MKKLIKKALKDVANISTNDSFTLFNCHQPEIPSAMKKQIEDKKD